MSANKQQKREWYHRNKKRVNDGRYERRRIENMTDEERLAYEWSLTPLVEAWPTRPQPEEGYTFLDFLLEAETV